MYEFLQLTLIGCEGIQYLPKYVLRWIPLVIGTTHNTDSIS